MQKNYVFLVSSVVGFMFITLRFRLNSEFWIRPDSDWWPSLTGVKTAKIPEIFSINIKEKNSYAQKPFTEDKISIKQLCVCFGSCYHESAFLFRAGFGKMAAVGNFQWRVFKVEFLQESYHFECPARLFWKAKQISFHVRSVSLILLRWVLDPNFRVPGDGPNTVSCVF